MSDSYESAERVHDQEGHQYHIGLGPGEVAPWILTCGDPARAERASKRLDFIDVERRHREFVSFTGSHKGLPLTIIATGIGCDNTEIATIELCQIVDDPTFIRVGTCGGLQDDMELEDLVVSTGSVRMENTSTWFVPEGFPAVAHYEVVTALQASAEEQGQRHHVGITATASGFYGGQGRKGLGFPPRHPDIASDLARIGVKNLEMETSTLFTLCAMRGFRAGAVCTVFAHRPKNQFIAPERKIPAEDAAVECALAAFHRLAAR